MPKQNKKEKKNQTEHFPFIWVSLMPITVRWKDAQTAQFNPHSVNAVTQKENLMANWVNKAQLAKTKGHHAHQHLLHLTGIYLNLVSHFHILQQDFTFPWTALPPLFPRHILCKRRKTGAQVHRKVKEENMEKCKVITLSHISKIKCNLQLKIILTTRHGSKQNAGFKHHSSL